MRLTVLGNPSRYLAPLAPGTGYLVEAAGATILLDCGQGVLRTLADRGGAPIGAVVITHFHFDHCLDLPPLLAALKAQRPTLLVPEASRGALDALARAYQFEGEFDTPGPVRGVREGDAVEVAPGVRLRFGPLRHSAPGVSVRVEAEGRALTYCSDGSATPALVQFARGSDTVLAHTLIKDVEPASDHARVHMTARSAGRFAADAGAGALWLSHRYWESRDEEMLAEARAAFGGPVILLKEGGQYQV